MGITYDKAISALTSAHEVLGGRLPSEDYYLIRAQVWATLALVDAQNEANGVQAEATAWSKQQVATMAAQQKAFQATILKALEEA